MTDGMRMHQKEAQGRQVDAETMEAVVDSLATAFIQKELRRQYLEDLEHIRSAPGYLPPRLTMTAGTRAELNLKSNYRIMGLREIPDA